MTSSFTRPAIKDTVLGVGLGISGAVALNRVLDSLLFGVTVADPISFLVAPVLTLTIAVFASAIPALGATRLDPAEVLRTE